MEEGKGEEEEEEGHQLVAESCSRTILPLPSK